MKFPRFKAKYGKNYVLKKNNKFLNYTTYLTESNNISDYNKKSKDLENKMRATKRTNLTISEVDEEEEKNNRYKYLRKGKLGQIKPKGKLNMDKKMREILGKHYKILLDDPLNPYGTCWPSNFLKAGYDTGFEYDNFQSGVPVLKLRSLGKKQLPPIKKKGFHFNNESSIYSNNKNTGGLNLYNTNSDNKNKNKNEEIIDIKTNKSENLQFNRTKDDKTKTLNGITEENEN